MLCSFSVSSVCSVVCFLSPDSPCERSRRCCNVSPAPRRAACRRSGRPQRRGVRRQPADAAAARAAVEEVPRKVRRADHQDPAGGRPAVDVRRSVPGAAPRWRGVAPRRRGRRPWSAPSSLRQGHWLPTRPVRLGRRAVHRPGLAVHADTPRSRAWPSWSPSSWRPAWPSSANTRAIANSRCSTPTRSRCSVKVLRDGAFHTVGLEEVVVGDAGRAGDRRRGPGRRPAGQGDRAVSSISR